MKVHKHTLRKQVRDAVLSEIGSGRLAADTKLNEDQLAASLGISRTPLREGLLLLEGEGVVASYPNRGFFVPGLSKEKVVEIYGVIAPLEALAVRQSEGRHENLSRELKAVNAKLRRETRSRVRQGNLDAQWHDVLISQCGNKTLQEMVLRLRSRGTLFDGAASRGTASHLPSCDQHDEIAGHIGAGDFEAACREVETHWREGTAVVCKWIDEQRSNEGDGDLA